MTDLINLSISALLKKFLKEEKPLDFYFLEYIDPIMNEKKMHCPLHATVGCTANFPPSYDNKDLFDFFDHIYRLHPNDRESIKTDYDKWYQEKKNLWSSSSSSSSSSNLTVTDIVTSHDVEDLFESSSTRPTTTIYNQDQRMAMAFKYVKVLNELVGLTNGEIEAFSNGDINNQQLKMKIKMINENFIKKLDEL